MWFFVFYFDKLAFYLPGIIVLSIFCSFFFVFFVFPVGGGLGVWLGLKIGGLFFGALFHLLTSKHIL